MSGVKNKTKRMKSSAEKKRKKDKANEVDQSSNKEENSENKFSRKKKQRNNQIAENGTVAMDKLYTEDGSGQQNKVANKAQDNKKKNSRKRKMKNEKKAGADRSDYEAVDNLEQQNVDETLRSTLSETQVEIESPEEHNETDTVISIATSKSKKARKKKNQLILCREEKNLSENRYSTEDDIHLISSGDEDCSKGMKKWVMEYHQRRPGLNVLQERIDDFITEHEAREEQERKEREAQAAEDGWTVVVHHKGRKKTTDTETGVAVGSFSQATILDKVNKKRSKQVGLDFYRFQKREAQKNEIMMLQSKFEQDKQRIQQMRAARKFRPY